ncbi:MAG TPA: SDR family oxidoreductase [Spirochaetota bacterium]|nr:SDR family oxidoreductase [Spirochaetota bacterium]HPG50752.1 SDR family oxidoreductase [Spirochaetota bacterium]HPN12603.1 SDR family oxidoreductase [Spirochaetota bacterium]
MSKRQAPFSGKTAIISGGSRGIGRAAALEFVKGGGSVCVIARNKKDLERTAGELDTARTVDSQSVTSIVCDATDIKKLRPRIDAFIKKNGVPDYLMNFVGYARPGYVSELSLDDFRNNMDANYYGQLVPILSVLPHFMKERRGHIVTCSSVLGFLGMFGYSAYTPTKFAICGLTESLRSEMKPFNIRFSILFPPDTDTPGFAKENETKPAAVMVLSEGGGLMTPEQVAQKLMRGVLADKFYIQIGQGRLLWAIVRHFPNLAHRILDGETAKAIKKAAKNR